MGYHTTNSEPSYLGGSIIKNIIIICAILFAAYFGYKKIVVPKSTIDTSQYSLARVSENPIPKNVIFELWKEVTIKTCNNFTEQEIELTKHTPAQCRDRVNEKHLDCVKTLSLDASEIINRKSESRRLGEQYFKCVLPKPTCNGIEVNSAEEAQEKCK